MSPMLKLFKESHIDASSIMYVWWLFLRSQQSSPNYTFNNVKRVLMQNVIYREKYLTDIK